MADFLEFVLGNFTLTFLVIGVVAALVSLAVRRPATGVDVADRLLAGYLFFAIGVSYFYNFVMHVFFAEQAAAFIGWQNSPFQYEVGYASLGFAAVAMFAYRSNFQARLGALLGPALFQWGAAVGHLRQIVVDHNYAPGNAGIILWTDLFMPVVGFVLLWLAYRRPSAVAQVAV
ncbi:DUF6790 family protein [Aeoliella sp. SH292]|uniref:DUF6790 family protein n=1 Tax=Aeoliella sp. SH292 TaxID=3454464 RepID=UPI003F9528A6